MWMITRLCSYTIICLSTSQNWVSTMVGSSEKDDLRLSQLSHDSINLAEVCHLCHLQKEWCS